LRADGMGKYEKLKFYFPERNLSLDENHWRLGEFNSKVFDGEALEKT